MSQDKYPIKKNNLNNNVASLGMREAKLLTLEESQFIPRYSSLYLSTPDLEVFQDSAEVPDLVCLSHLRWNFVYQRPQHLLSRCAKQRRVFLIEEPIFGSYQDGKLDVSKHESGVWVVVPHLPEGLSESAITSVQQQLIDELFAEAQIHKYILWYYTPMAMGFTRHLEPLAVVYDCMDELSLFTGAPRSLKDCEAELFKRADLVFTGGQSLYEVKRNQHPNVYAFPSSIDRAHFAQARSFTEDPADQADIPQPRLGFFGVIDERMDLNLLEGIAEARPDWHLVIIGPVVKIDPAILPRHKNIHYLGGKNYQELPAYVAGWDVAMLPFACNESTRFISPTKTPEYLAAGKPVVSTSIRDVVKPYGQAGMVYIADTVAEFVTAAEAAMNKNSDRSGWLQKVDAFLAQTSWDRTWEQMIQLVESVMGVSKALPNENRHASTIALNNPLTALKQQAGK
jgi:UDP-galactopyranose mutase